MPRVWRDETQRCLHQSAVETGDRVCKECTAQKREAGTPYRCTRCGLWHAATHFASKHQNPRWSMYRVCLSCDALKQCFSCTKKLTKEYFTVPAWRASKPERRVCLHCQKQGKWTCARCYQKIPMQQFSHYNNRRPGGGQNGRQTCNACRASVVQATVRKRAAKSSLQRLQSVRETLRRRHILRETWEAIAEHRNKRNSATSAVARLEPLRKRLRRHQETITRQPGARQQPSGRDTPPQALSVPDQESKQYVYVPFLQCCRHFVDSVCEDRPPSHLWETVPRRERSPASNNALCPRVPNVRNLYPNHQRIWENSQQAQKPKRPHVPPSRVAS